MKPVLCIDVDSTVWDTATWVHEAVLGVTGETPNLVTISTWTHILETYGEEATTEIFDRVLSPKRVRERQPYPGSTEVLRQLWEKRDISVHFVTRNHNPEDMIPHLELWLKVHFGQGVGLTVTTGDKLSVLHKLGAFGLIDDRPEILERAADAGLWVAAKIQRWNREFIAERADVRGFSDWREVPDLLPGPIRGD